MKGRKPTPVQLRILSGNPGKRAIPNAPVASASPPSPPPDLSPEAKKVWRREARGLISLGVVGLPDRTLFAHMCELIVDYDRYRSAMASEPDIVSCANGSIAPHPYIHLMHKAREHIMKLAAEFGMTPASRVRLAVPPAAPENKFEKFVSPDGRKASA